MHKHNHTHASDSIMACLIIHLCFDWLTESFLQPFSSLTLSANGPPKALKKPLQISKRHFYKHGSLLARQYLTYIITTYNMSVINMINLTDEKFLVSNI